MKEIIGVEKQGGEKEKRSVKNKRQIFSPDTLDQILKNCAAQQRNQIDANSNADIGPKAVTVFQQNEEEACVTEKGDCKIDQFRHPFARNITGSRSIQTALQSSLVFQRTNGETGVSLCRA